MLDLEELFAKSETLEVAPVVDKQKEIRPLPIGDITQRINHVLHALLRVGDGQHAQLLHAKLFDLSPLLPSGIEVRIFPA